MNRFLTASALVGSTLGYFHGRQIRPVSQSVPEEVLYSARDAAMGAVVYPFVIPIGVYQIATKIPADTCVFKSLSALFSQPLSEILK